MYKEVFQEPKGLPFKGEMEVDVVPLDVCGVVFGRPYMYTRNAIFIRRENLFCLIKDGKSFIINSHKFKSKVSLVSTN